MKKQYCTTMLVRLLLGFLFVINALGHSSATDILGQNENQKELDATRISSTFAEKETPDGRKAHQYHVRKLGFGGKKKSMVIHNKESNMEFSGKEKDSSEGGGRRASKISAEDDDALKKSMGRLREGDNQEDQSIARNLSESTNSNHSQQISEESHRAHDGGTDNNTQKVEEKGKRSFQTEEEEVMNFVRMDYGGMARRKPPINNDEPRN
ncbi:uncharacterized protein LOC114748387 [Neltuma alba]|uniref:uncharacterized protein LOC114748387 n=1 Tax=Neltuma alba TaxID=207710 RepID=UPI0010A3BE60|nr:uncharacterized protein LOC114748387 [Prosopis alba]